MEKQLSEVELNQISSIVYLDIIGDPYSSIAKAYNKGEQIILGEVIDYYTGKGKYEGNPEGPRKLAERFTEDDWGGKTEIQYWKEFLYSQKIDIDNI